MTPEFPAPQELSPAALALLARRAGAGPEPDFAPREHGPLSFPQLTQWFFAHLDPQSTVFNLPKILTLRGDLDHGALRTALQAIVDRQAALRTVYRLDGDEPVQRVLAARPIELALHDLRTAVAGDRPRLAAELLATEAGRRFDLASDQLIRATLLRMGEAEWQLQVTAHHIAWDAWSNGIFLAEFEQQYRAAVVGTPAVLAPLRTQVPDAAAWQRSHRDTPAFDNDLRYWREQLHGVTPLDVPPLEDAAGGMPRHHGERRQFRLNTDAWQSVLACARHHQCTPFAVMFAAWAVLTARRYNQQRCLLGVTIAGRTHAEWEPLIGNFVNVLPLVADLDAATTFRALLAQVHQRAGEALAHQHIPFQELAAGIAPTRRSGGDTLVPVLFNLRNTPLRLPDHLPGLTVEGLTAPLRGTVAPLCLNVTPDAAGALLELDFDPDHVTAATAERWLDAYVTLLTVAMGDPAILVARLPVMGSAEADQLDEWNRTDWPRDRTMTLPTLLARQAAMTPDRIAVTAGDAEWSYRDLAQQAQRVAGLLRARGIGPGSFVGICMERCAGVVAALAGVLESGAAYVPIDPKLPNGRIVGMLADAGVTLMVTGPGARDDLAPACERLPWDTPGESPARSTAGRTVTAADPAYVIFTSGSTGRPKGAVLSQSGIVNQLTWLADAFPLEADDAMLQQASISFDGSVWEFWLPLTSGARLVMAPPGMQRDPNAVIDLMNARGVTTLQVVPTMLRALLETGRLGTVGSLRWVYCGGEALTWDLIHRFRELHASTLINLYGPTETTINATFWIAGNEVLGAPVPIGRPIANMRAYVLDASGTRVPIGVTGELCLAGDGVGLGYLDRPELTAERFVIDPFRGASGHRMYRTGDMARMRDNGELEFLGRRDTQVKIRGFRIELGEIETALGEVPGVRLAAVIVQAGPGDDQRLVAYVEPAAATTLTPVVLRSALKERLPEYMVPATIVIVAALPLTSSGKIDRVALGLRTTVPDQRIDSDGESDAPESTLELGLRQIWGEVLGLDHVGLDDDFFDLGGHSLLAARMINQLNRGTGYRAPLATLFKASTIRSFARELMKQLTPGTGIDEVQAGQADRTPFFMLTGDWTGGGLYCRALAKALDPAQPLYAIAPMRPSADAYLTTIEGMAAAHLAQIRRMQPAGPYRLGGYCSGGLITYEIARQLHAEGDEVELLLLVDSVAPKRGGRLVNVLSLVAAAVSTRDSGRRLARRAHYAQRLTDFLEMPLIHGVATAAGYPLRLLRRMRRATTAGAVAATGDAMDPVLRATTQLHIRAQDLYRHRRYGGRVDLIRSRDPVRPASQQLRKWQRVAPGAVLHEAEASHTSVLSRDLPVILRDQLARIDTRRLVE